MPKTIPTEETAYVGSRKANVHVEIRAHSSMNQTRKAKERHRNSKGDGNAKKTHQILLVKVCQEMQTDYFVWTSGKGVVGR